MQHLLQRHGKMLMIYCVRLPLKNKLLHTLAPIATVSLFACETVGLPDLTFKLSSSECWSQATSEEQMHSALRYVSGWIFAVRGRASSSEGETDERDGFKHNMAQKSHRVHCSPVASEGNLLDVPRRLFHTLVSPCSLLLWRVFISWQKYIIGSLLPPLWPVNERRIVARYSESHQVQRRLPLLWIIIWPVCI